MRRRVALIIAAFTVTSCGSKPAEDPVKWSSAPEDSLVTSMSDEISSQVTRCWKDRGAQQCLSAAQNGPRTAVSAYLVSRPRTHAEFGASGYSCEIYLDPNNGLSLFKEIISRATSSVATNTVAVANPDSKPWTKAYVADYAGKNGIVMDAQWFNCDLVAQAISTGSLETITTTTIGRSTLFGS